MLVEEVDPADEQAVHKGYVVEFGVLFLQRGYEEDEFGRLELRNSERAVAEGLIEK